MKLRLLFPFLPLILVLGCRTVDGGGSDLHIIGGELFDGMPEVGILTRNGAMHCTATLVSPTRIITAAHCVDQRLYSSSKFAFATGRDLKSSIPIAVDHVVAHPQYDLETNANDIAYADLHEASPLTVSVLYKGPYSGLLGQSLVLVGYGSSELNGQGSSGTKRLVSMKVSAISDSKLRFEEVGKSACSGDSGGPAFVRQSDGTLALAGITSCGAVRCNSYGVYTRIDPYLGFLGLKTDPDTALTFAQCGRFLNTKACADNAVVSCHNDCFEPAFDKKSCVSENHIDGRCIESSGLARCVDSRYISQKLTFRKVVATGAGQFKFEPYKGLGIFIDHLTNGTDSLYGATDASGGIQDVFVPGVHTLSVRRSDRSYSPASLHSFVSTGASQDIVMTLGDTPLQLTLTATVAPDEAYYVTGEGPLFEDWKIARRMSPKGGAQWIYEDALSKKMAIRILKMKNIEPQTNVKPDDLRHFKVLKVQDSTPSFPEGWVTMKLSSTDISLD
ncbi:MAG: trypsin-like serine protease [Chitinophagaceae bacterium]|nr:trypsin-like serine protease [Oligoflexus sp.]